MQPPKRPESAGERWQFARNQRIWSTLAVFANYLALGYVRLGAKAIVYSVSPASSKPLSSIRRSPGLKVQIKRKTQSLLKSLIKLDLSKTRFSAVYVKNRITGVRAMNIIVKALSALTLSFCLNSGALAQFNSDQSYTNDIQPIEIDGKFEPLGDGLAGDSIEHDRGTLSFYHTDVDIPGNSNLPVRFARSYTLHGTAYTGNHLGGWQIDVPFITTRMRITGYGPEGAIWDNPSINYCFLKATDRAGGNFDQLSKFYSGFKLHTPGGQVQPIMEVPSGAATNFPYEGQYSYTATTTNHWKIYCEESGGSNTGDVIAVAPNGDKYEFRTLSVTAAGPEEILVPSGGRRGNVVPEIHHTWHFNLMATRVTDVHGNWVAYDYEREFGHNDVAASGYPGTYTPHNYESYRLKTIRSNDGRRIDINYNGPNNPGVTAHPYIELIQEGETTSVSSVTANGRTWTYEYAQNGDANYVPIQSFKNLRRVVLPDGRDWILQLPIQHHRAHRAYNSYDCNVIDTNDPTPQPGVMHWVNDVYVEHPSGARVDFDFQVIKNPIWKLGTLSTITNGHFCDDPDPEYTISNAVVKKTITAPQSPTSVWNFSYDQYAFNQSGLGDVKRRTETRPDGSTIERLVLIHNEGDIVRKTISGGGANYVETTQFQNLTPNWGIWGNVTGTLSQAKRYKHPRLKQPTQVTITSDGDTFGTTTAYNTNLSASSYSYGSPTNITRTGTGSGSRTTAITYVPDRGDWVLGLTNTITRNSKLFDDFDYDSKGRLTRHKKFGTTLANISYYTSGDASGRINTISDALNRTYTLSSYKRGIPRTILRPDGNSITRVVDNNGWVTSQTNARNHTTGFQYNNMGWLTRIDRPASWADTVISYGNLGNGLTQTSTRGNSRTVNTMDGYHRTILLKAEDLTGNSGTVYTKTNYDGLGRAIFNSFPSFSSAASTGTNTTYDALGRVTQQAENVAPFATTSTSYLSGGRVRVTDPTNAQTTTTYQSWGSPSTSEPTLIQQPEGMSTAMTYDTWGNLLTAAQGGFTQTWTYDSRLRLCNHHTPEQGGTVYAYNNANEVTYTALGQGTGCSSNSADRVQYTYDAMGRQTLINYPSGTSDISIAYDPNGNVTQNNRGGVNWSYAYNELDLVTQETLSIDGRTYATSYGYDTTGNLSTQNTPGSMALSYSPNGFGQPTKASVGSYNYASAATYHANGAIKRFNTGNSRFFETTQDARQMTNMMHYSHGFGWNLSRDANGRITNIDDWNNVRDRSYTYDGLGRLVSGSGEWGAVTYQYDGTNNLTRKQIGSRVVEIQFDGNNRVSRARDSAAGNVWQNYAHDSRGNVTDNGPMNFTYDAAMQPVAIFGSESGAFTYDGLYKRVKQIINGETIYSVYSVSGQMVYRDNATTNEQTDYVRLGDMLVAEKTGATNTYLYVDHVGSPIMGAETSSVTWQEHYTPFGEKWTSAAQAVDNVGYTGHISDTDTALTYMETRYYDPVIGRFLSVDPVGYASGGTGYFNRYAYVMNDPVNALDLDGRSCSRIDEIQSCPGTYGSRLGGPPEVNPNEGDPTPSHEPEFNEWGGPAGTNINPRTNGAAQDGSLEVMGFVIGLKGIDKAFKGGAAFLFGREAAEATVNPNTLNHIFGQSRHKLDGLVRKFGSREKTYRAMQKALDKSGVQPDPRGVFEQVVKIKGANVTIRGAVVNGETRIATAFIP